MNEYDRKRIPYVTVILIAINVIVFIAMEWQIGGIDADRIYNSGSMYWRDVFYNHQYYRLITCMFLHSGTDHIVSNMFMLGILGYQIEKAYGPVKYLITYFACGICGGFLSGYCSMISNAETMSVGASGAIMGMFGVLLVMIFKSRKSMGEISSGRLLVLFLLMVFGNMQADVDWLAHLGGALSGVIFALILYNPKNREQLLNL